MFDSSISVFAESVGQTFSWFADRSHEISYHLYLLSDSFSTIKTEIHSLRFLLSCSRPLNFELSKFNLLSASFLIDSSFLNFSSSISFYSHISLTTLFSKDSNSLLLSVSSLNDSSRIYILSSYSLSLFSIASSLLLNFSSCQISSH
jgi:hypothetical protein